MQAACGQRMAATASSSQSAASALLRPCRVVAVPFVATACGRQGAAACALTAACSRGGHSADRASRALLQRCAAASSTGAGDGGVTTAKPGSSGRMTYRPLTFADMVNDAVGSVQAALGNGLTRLEVEFPALPIKLDAYKGSSDVFIDSNVQLALAAAKKLAASGRKVHLLVPDDGEYQRTHRMFKASLELMDGVTIGHLKERDAKPLGGLMNILTGAGNDAPPSAAAGAAADTYLVINATCTDLLALQDYVKGWSEAEARSKALVLWNLELDTLRGDLGLPAFPSKDVHYKFLSGFRPVFFLRPREYSKSVNVAPFLVNYSGALFREYPGPWQVMIRQDNGEYACIAEDVTRYNLGELKDELMVAMGLNTEEEGSTMQLLRRGFKTSTWYEDDYDLEESHEWRL